MHRAVTTALALLVAGPLGAAEFHVGTNGSDANPGNEGRPFRSISAAARVAQPGDTITVHQGVYRERINPPRGGTSDKMRITYRAAEGAEVIIKGSERVRGWEQAQEGLWKVAVPNSTFGNDNPFAVVIGGEWSKTPRDGFDRHTGAVYLNGDWLDEARELKNVLAPPGGRLLWKANVSPKNTTIWAQFGDADPNAELVEINVRPCIFYPDAPGRDFITVRGFTMRQAAPQWSGAMSEQVGLIGTHWSKGWIIEDNVISHSVNTGITLGRYDLALQGETMPEPTGPGFVKSIELAIEYGWTREKIGGHIVRRNHISHCEKNGIHGSLGGIFSTIEDNTICDIALRGWTHGPDVAGLKLLGSQDTIIRRNHIHRCRGVGGLWLDWMAQGTRVTQNLFHDNTRDLFVEVNHGPFLIDHNLFFSPILESSGGGAYAHNLFAGPLVLRVEGDRHTPFHRPHDTRILGLSKVIGDDERFYNNLFIGQEGLAVYDAWKPENLQTGGNVYLSGAKPSADELNAVVDPEFAAELELKPEPDGWWLSMHTDPAWRTMHHRPLVSTELLGKAIASNVRYEQRNGSPFRLDTDYFGHKRKTTNPFPGPFTLPAKDSIRLKIRPPDTMSTASRP